jgi:hypothetical protein
MQRLKEKWGITSNLQIILILITFSLAGSSVIVLKGWYFNFLGFTEETSFWLKAPAYLAFIFPAYQLLILTYGTLLGQFKFFWNKERKLLLSIYRLIA